MHIKCTHSVPREWYGHLCAITVLALTGNQHEGALEGQLAGIQLHGAAWLLQCLDRVQ
jgi:hypothetical protein